MDKRVFLAIAPVLAACAAGGGDTGTQVSAAAAPSSSSLHGTRWIAVARGAAEERNAPRLEFVGEGRISGFTGCNMLGGAWKQEGSRVTFGSITTTKRMCLGIDGEVEKRFLAALGNDSQAERKGDRLVLSGPGGAVFELVPAR